MLIQKVNYHFNFSVAMLETSPGHYRDSSTRPHLGHPLTPIARSLHLGKFDVPRPLVEPDRFANSAGDKTWRVWPSVRKELFWMRSLLPFAFADSRRPWSPVVSCSD